MRLELLAAQLLLHVQLDVFPLEDKLAFLCGGFDLFEQLDGNAEINDKHAVVHSHEEYRQHEPVQRDEPRCHDDDGVKQQVVEGSARRRPYEGEGGADNAPEVTGGIAVVPKPDVHFLDENQSADQLDQCHEQTAAQNDDGVKQLEEARLRLVRGENQLTMGWESLEEGRQMLDGAQAELDAQAAKQPGCRGLSLAKLQLYSNKMFDADKLSALEQALQKLN